MNGLVLRCKIPNTAPLVQQYSVGDTGPAGGIIYSVEDLGNDFRYLEAGNEVYDPVGINGAGTRTTLRNWMLSYTQNGYDFRPASSSYEAFEMCNQKALLPNQPSPPYSPPTAYGFMYDPYDTAATVRVNNYQVGYNCRDISDYTADPGDPVKWNARAMRSFLQSEITEDYITYDLDTPSDISFRVDLSAVENTQIGSIFGVASQQFDLPSSTNNDKFFKAAYNINTSNARGFKNSVECQVLQGGNEVYKGNLILDEVVTDGRRDSVYKVTVVNETIDFQTEIQDQYIRDLDFSDYNHDYTMANITGSWATSSFFNGDILYPIADYGTDKTDNTIPVLETGGQVGKMDNPNSPLKPIQFKPAIRTKTLIDKIFDSVGYEYSSSFINSADFQNTYVLTTPSDKLGIESQGYQDSGFYVNITGSQFIASAPSYVKQTYPQEQYDPVGGYNPATSTYTVQTDGQYAFRIIGNISAPDGSGSPTRKEYAIQIRVNGNLQFAQFYDLIGSTYGQVSFITPGLTLEAGDTVEVYHRYFFISTGTSPGATLASQAFSTIYAPTTVVGGTVNLGQQFDQEAKSLDFLKGVIEMFNLVVVPKTDERKTLVIEPFDTWRDSGEIKDWTFKIDNATKVSIKHPIQDQPRELKYSLLEDEDPLNQYSLTNFRRDEVYGTHTYTADTDVAQGTREIGSFFAATPTKGVTGAGNIIIPQLYKKDQGEKATFQFKPRLLYRLNERPTNAANGGKIYVKDDDGNSVGITEYSTLHILNELPATSATKGLHYNTNRWYPFHQNFAEGKTINGLFNEYWGRYINELYDDDARMLTCNIFFEPFELSQISLNDKIFIKDAYYRINKISGFNISKKASVQVELLKAPVSAFKFKRHRVYDVDLDRDIIVTATGFNDFSGGITYTDVDTGNTYTTASFVGNIARRDGFVGVNDKALWKDNANLTLQTEGKNTVDGSNDFDPSVGFAVGSVTSGSFKKDVDRVFALGSQLTIGQEAKSTLNVGDNNTIGDRAEYTSLLNTTNANVSENGLYATIVGGGGNSVSGSNATIIASNNSSMNNAEDAVILAGDDVIIDNSNQSVAIGQDLIISGGNSNMVIGNFDTQTRSVTDMINTVVINPNRDIESRENLGGEDFSGRAYLGSYQEIGSHFSDNTKLTLSAGQTLYLTGSTYSHDSLYDVAWSGGDGTAIVYLPSVTPNGVFPDKGQGGYKRYLRFTADGTIDSGKNVVVAVQPGEYLNGQFNGSYTLDAEYQNFEIYGVTESYWRVLEAGVPDVSNGGHSGTYGSFFSTQDQAIVTSGSAQLITLNNTQASNKITLSGSGAIQMEYNGAYNFSYTATVTNSDNAVHYAYFWVRYNGVDYPNSTTVTTIPARKAAGNPSSKPITVNLLDVAVSDGDKIELWWQGDSTLLSLDYTSYGGSIPASPSVRAIIQAV